MLRRHRSEETVSDDEVNIIKLSSRTQILFTINLFRLTLNAVQLICTRSSSDVRNFAFFFFVGEAGILRGGR